jgi:hypothetical protein
LSNTCTGTKRDGSPCTLPSNGSSGLCWAHDPANAERRRRGQSRGGRNKPSRELQAIKRQLQELADGVLAGEVVRADAAVCGQLLNVKLRAVEAERKIKETEELEERIEALERTQDQKAGNRMGRGADRGGRGGVGSLPGVGRGGEI